MRLNSGKAIVVLLAVLASWLGVFLLRATEFGGSWNAITPTGWTALLSWLLLFCTGYLIGLVPIRVSAAGLKKPPASWFDKWIRRLAIASGVGALLIIYDFAYLRGYGFDTPVEIIRQSEVNNYRVGSAASPVSGIGRILVPCVLVGWMLAMFRTAPLRWSSWVLLCTASLVILVEQAMFEGGRNFVACTIVATVITWLLRPEGWRTGFKGRTRLNPMALIAVGGASIVMFGAIFIDRVQTRGVDWSEGYAVFAENFSITVPYSTIDSLQGPGAPVRFVSLMFWVYATQGPNEFDNILKNPPSRYGYGALQFSQLAQAASRVLGFNLTYNVFDHMTNPGTYTTILGPSYLDFGLSGSMILGFLFGLCTCLSVRVLSTGVVGPLALPAPILVTIALFSPMISMVLNMWLVIAIAIAIGYAWRLKRLRRKARAAQPPAAPAMATS